MPVPLQIVLKDVPKEVTSRRASSQLEREHLSVASRRASAHARRHLQDAARKSRGETKARARPTRRVRQAKPSEA